MNKLTVSTMALFFIVGCNINDKYKDSSRAYYGDFDSNKVYSINMDKMQLESTTEGGDGAYGLEAVGNNLLVSLTRKDTSVDIIDAKTRKILRTVELGYQPREVSTSPSKKYTVVSGRDIPAHTLFNAKTGEIIDSFNLNSNHPKITDFGGQNATGHPFFVNENEYLILDRVNREIRLYDVNYGLEDTLDTETSTHHILRKGAYLYVAQEGSGSSETKISPAILKLRVDDSQIRLVKTAYLKNSNTPDVNIKDMGIHHINFHYDGNHIYTGSNDGYVYVINSRNMRVVDYFESGKGGGHTDFSKKRKIAMVTSHKSPFVTMVNVQNPNFNRVIKHINVSEHHEGSHVLQGHTQCISDDENRFYGAATSNGDFFEIDLNKKRISKKLHLGGNLEQGFMYQSPEGGFAKPKTKFSTNSLILRHSLSKKVLTGSIPTLRFLNKKQDQGWDVQMRTHNTFSLKNRKTNQCLSSQHSNRIKTTTCNNKDQKQIWTFKQIRETDKVYIQNMSNNRCLKGSTYYSRPLLAECSSRSRFQWEVTSALNLQQPNETGNSENEQEGSPLFFNPLNLFSLLFPK